MKKKRCLFNKMLVQNIMFQFNVFQVDWFFSEDDLDDLSRLSVNFLPTVFY